MNLLFLENNQDTFIPAYGFPSIAELPSDFLKHLSQNNQFNMFYAMGWTITNSFIKGLSSSFDLLKMQHIRFFFSYFVVHSSVCVFCSNTGCKTCESQKSEPWCYAALAYQRSSAQGSRENSFLSHFIPIILFEMSHTTMIRRNVSCRGLNIKLVVV